MEHKWRASRDLELLLGRQNDPSKQLPRKERGNKDDVRERAIFVRMPCSVFFPPFLFPRILHSPVLSTPVWWTNLCSLAPCVLHTFGLHQTCIRQDRIKLRPLDQQHDHHLSSGSSGGGLIRLTLRAHRWTIAARASRSPSSSPASFLYQQL